VWRGDRERDRERGLDHVLSDEQPAEVEVATGGRGVEWRPQLTVTRVHIGAVVQQQLHHLALTVYTTLHTQAHSASYPQWQWREAATTSHCVHTGSVLRQQPGIFPVYTSLQTDNHTSNPPLLSFFTGRMPFLQPNQQRQSTEGKRNV